MEALVDVPRRTWESVKGNRWVSAIIVLLLLLATWRLTQLPVIGAFQIRTVTAGSFSLAFLAMAQAIVIISGGFNMAVGAMMVFANCFSAWLMAGRDLVACLGIAVVTLVLTTAMSALMGYISDLSGVPDIIVTLALSFAIQGAALMILGGPGGGTSKDFSQLLVGGFSDPLPSVLWLVAVVLLLWVPLYRSRFGKAIYAVGSDRRAAFLSGVSPRRGKVSAYLVSGFLAGLSGLVVTAYTASGEPRATIGQGALMSSVACVVIGGVSLAGGRGGLFGPVVAAFILSLIPAIMLGAGVDPNSAEVARGVIIIGVVMLGARLDLKRRSK
jgi:ribose transport system permease protein